MPDKRRFDRLERMTSQVDTVKMTVFVIILSGVLTIFLLGSMVAPEAVPYVALLITGFLPLALFIAKYIIERYIQ